MTQDYSFWEYDVYHRLWDYCIVGSGINGISTGISILEREPEANVLIVDRWFIPLGASTRNAGFSCFGSPSEILGDIKLMGEDEAMLLVQKRWSGLQKLISRLQDSNAQYEKAGGYEVFHQDQFEKIADNLTYLNNLVSNSIGINNVFNIVPIPNGIRGFSNAIFNSHEGQLHPVFMMEHLKKTFLSLGGKIWTGLSIDAIEDQNDHIVLKSKSAFPLTSKKAIVTINAFARQLLPALDVHGARNHVLVTEPLKLSWKGCFHYDEGFYYFRNIENRILLGGARNKDFMSENTDQFGSNPVIKEALHRFLYTHLANPETKIEFEWSGIIAIGNEKSPIIQAISPRLFVGVRCSGMGIALASLTGEQLAELACNSNPKSIV